ncbi:hypothetical protein KBD08_00385 [Candidatus Babeliales bacterium]|nr:hypothetical protein [Candidatus Babeliales bacterium]
MYIIYLSFMFLICFVNSYGAEAGHSDDRKLSWITRFDNATDEQLLQWFKDPNEPVNLSQEGRILLHDVMKNQCISQDVKNALLDRTDLDIEIKNMRGDTALSDLIRYVHDHPWIASTKLLFYINMVRKLRKCGARLENSSEYVKSRLLFFGGGLSLQQSYCQLCTREDVSAFRRRLHEEKSPLQDICSMVAGNAFWAEYTDCCDYFIYEPLAVLLATRKTIIHQNTKEQEIIQPTFCIQERYLQLQEFMPQATIMQFLRDIVLSNASSLVDVDLQKEEEKQRVRAKIESVSEYDKVVSLMRLEDLRNHKLRLWVLSLYHDFHKLHSENAVL